MKASIVKIAVFAFMTATSLVAHAENESFPTPGMSYRVTWAENALRDIAQIKVIRKGEGTWILVEYTSWPMLRTTPTRPGSQDGDKPAPLPKMEDRPKNEKWINTQWLIEATELDAEKK